MISTRAKSFLIEIVNYLAQKCIPLKPVNITNFTFRRILLSQLQIFNKPPVNNDFSIYSQPYPATLYNCQRRLILQISGIIILFVTRLKIMKKVHPLQLSNSSVINLSSNEGLGGSAQLSCRICDVTTQPPTHQHPLIYPCNCSLPIHRGCILSEYKATMKARHKLVEDKHQQRYNCIKCSQVIRFTSNKQLKCRSCKQIPEFAKKHCCMCTTLLISFIIILAMLIGVIIITETNIVYDKIISQAAIIGLSIGIAVAFFIFLYFFISEVLIKISYKIKLLENSPSPRRREAKNHSISIVDCG